MLVGRAGRPIGRRDPTNILRVANTGESQGRSPEVLRCSPCGWIATRSRGTRRPAGRGADRAAGWGEEREPAWPRLIACGTALGFLSWAEVGAAARAMVVAPAPSETT